MSKQILNIKVEMPHPPRWGYSANKHTIGVITKFVDVETVLAFSQTSDSSFHSGGSILRFLSEGNGTSDRRIATNNCNSLNHDVKDKVKVKKKQEKRCVSRVSFLCFGFPISFFTFAPNISGETSSCFTRFHHSTHNGIRLVSFTAHTNYYMAHRRNIYNWDTSTSYNQPSWTTIQHFSLLSYLPWLDQILSKTHISMIQTQPVLYLLQSP